LRLQKRARTPRGRRKLGQGSSLLAVLRDAASSSSHSARLLLHLMATGEASLVACRRSMVANASHRRLRQITVSTSPAPLRRKAAARSYSGEVKQATPCSKVGNSITTKRWNLA